MSDTIVYLNDLKISAINFEQGESNGDRKIVRFNFKVTSENYHNVTTLLYKNNFTIHVPKAGLEFSATINNYSTSITNLYERNAVGDFYLELIETEMKGIS